MLDNETGCIVEVNDIDSLEDEIMAITEKGKRDIYRRNCVKRAKNFSEEKMFEEYLKLYEDCTYSTEFSI